MDAETKQKIQIGLVVAMLVVGARTAYILYERKQDAAPVKTEVVENRHLDDYVYLKPSHAHDLKSASVAISGKTVWVRNGNAITFFPYDRASKRADVAHPVGLLPPLEPLAIKSVAMNGNAMLAVFERTKTSSGSGAAPAAGSAPGAGSGAASATGTAPKSDGMFAAQIGVVRNGQSTIYLDDIFFLEDPHSLYKHWSAETWSAVERHEIVKGMSEMQASSAMGVGHPVTSSGDYGNRTLEFSDGAGGTTVTVTFASNRAIAIER
jgi:hypothetical protein